MEPTEQPPEPKPPPTVFDRVWPWVIRGTGIFVVLYETIHEHIDRPSLLILAGTLIGLPEFVQIERRRRDGGK